MSKTVFITFHRSWSMDDLKQEIERHTGIIEFERWKPLKTPAVFLTCKSTSDCEKVIDKFNNLTVSGYSMKVKFADDEARRPYAPSGVKINPVTNMKLKNLSEHTKEEDLRSLFEGLGCGKIVSMTIFDVEEYGIKQTRAFVCFEDPRDIMKIREKPLCLHGKKLFIEPTFTSSLKYKEKENADENLIDEQSFPRLRSMSFKVPENDEKDLSRHVTFGTIVQTIDDHDEEDDDPPIENDEQEEVPDVHFGEQEEVPDDHFGEQEKYITSLEFRVRNLEYALDYLHRYVLQAMIHPGNQNFSKGTTTGY